MNIDGGRFHTKPYEDNDDYASSLDNAALSCPMRILSDVATNWVTCDGISRQIPVRWISCTAVNPALIPPPTPLSADDVTDRM